VIVDNESGVLARVIGLFSARGYNIDSLTVAEVDHLGHRSRITVVTTGTPQVIVQIKAQLERMVPSMQVHDLTVEGPSVSVNWRCSKCGQAAKPGLKPCVWPKSFAPMWWIPPWKALSLK
jgi:acetolactate synthase regulatory subunit